MSDLSNVTLENPSEEHIQALLSKLAYVDLTPNFNFASLNSTGNIKFSDAEKNYLKDNFIVIDCSTNHPEYSSGFQGFFLQNKKTNEVFLTIRGTEKDKLEDYPADADIVSRGMAIRQFVDAYNYYIKTTTPEGNSNNIIKYETTKPAEGIAYVETDDGYYCYLEQYQGTGTGLSSVSITGHSLGGHLAALVSTATGVPATIFNAPGYEFKQILGFSFVFADGTKNEIMAPVDAIMERLLKVYMTSNNQIKHIYNDNGSEWTANYGRVWDNSTPIFCLQTNDSEHGIDEICTAYYAYETIKNNSTGSDCFLREDSRTTFQEAFNNFYKAYCLYSNKSYEELDYSNYYEIQTLTSEIKLWMEQKAENNTSIKVDSFNQDSWINVEGTANNDIIYLGGGVDGTNTGQGNDTVYGGDFFNKTPVDYTKEIFLGTGSDTYFGFNGRDTVYGGDEDSTEDVNRIYLGAGSDWYRGGNSIDIVDGGSGDTGGLIGLESKDMTDSKDDFNIADLGGGNDIYTGGKGADHIRGESGNDILIGGDGQNELDGGSDNDILIGGIDDDYLTAGGGKDYICSRAGNNTINCGWYNELNLIAINNTSDGIDTVYNLQGDKILTCAGGFDLSSIHEENGDLIIKGNKGNTIICKDRSYPKYESPESLNPTGYPMPKLYFPDGSVYQWQIGHYTDEGQWVEGHYRNSGTQWPSYVEEPSIETWQSIANVSFGSSLTNADQLIQAMSTFGANNSKGMDSLSSPVENVSEMYSLAAASDLNKKAA